MLRICLIEDEEKVSAFIRKGLTEHGYKVEIAGNSIEGLQLLEQEDFDLVILDIMLPGINGIETCKIIRNRYPSILILMLTALGTTDDKVSGLRAGSDDYLLKPFHFDELLARLEALSRRLMPVGAAPQILSFSDLKLDTWSKTAERAGVSILLTAKEYTLLELFLKNPNKTLSRQYIAEKVWGIGFDTGTNVIDVYVNYLRNKVDKGYPVKFIHTAIGMGYILKEK